MAAMQSPPRLLTPDRIFASTGAGRWPAIRANGAPNAGLAQMVEHLICNQGAAGSIPAAGTTTKIS